MFFSRTFGIHKILMKKNNIFNTLIYNAQTSLVSVEFSLLNKMIKEVEHKTNNYIFQLSWLTYINCKQTYWLFNIQWTYAYILHITTRKFDTSHSPVNAQKYATKGENSQRTGRSTLSDRCPWNWDLYTEVYFMTLLV